MARYNIILPVRNGGNYFKECINNILQQSLPDFKLKVLDNCSTDGSLEWIKNIDDDRIEIYPASSPLSIEENWGRIISIPKEEFITLIGHDDILHHNYLSIIDDLINKYPEASLYQTHFRYIDASGNALRLCKPMDEIQSAPEFLSFFLMNMIDVMGTGFMMRSKDYDEIGGIPAYPNLLFADFELWINLTKKGFKATAMEECFSYRLHSSATTKSPDIKFQQAFARFIDYLQKLNNSDPIMRLAIERYVIQFIGFYAKGLSHRLLRTPKNKREGLSVNSFLKQCKSFADLLVPGNNFDPEKQFSVRLASQIDSNALTRNLFLAFKKINPKPVYS